MLKITPWFPNLGEGGCVSCGKKMESGDSVLTVAVNSYYNICSDCATSLAKTLDNKYDVFSDQSRVEEVEECGVVKKTTYSDGRPSKFYFYRVDEKGKGTLCFDTPKLVCQLQGADAERMWTALRYSERIE